MPSILSGVDNSGREQTEMGLYDRFADGEPFVKATKVVDITDIVPGEATQAVLKFSSDTSGAIVQFQDRYDVGEDIGMSTYFHLNEGLAAQLDGYFMVHTWGFSPESLIRVITDIVQDRIW